MVVGSLGPWGKGAGDLTVSGTDGDGMITLGIALCAAIALLAGDYRDSDNRRWLGAAIGLMGLACGIIGVLDWQDIESLGEGEKNACSTRGVSSRVVGAYGWLPLAGSFSL